MSITVSPVTPDRWTDVVQAFGRQAKPGSCWCQRFRHHDDRDNQTALQHEIDTADVPIGLVASVDDAPVGWTRVVPRSSLPGVTGNRALQRLLDEDPSAWWVTCFVVQRDHRGAGVGTALLRSATTWALEHGASVLDGHPVDVGRLRGRPSPAAVFTGTRSMFVAAGFSEIGRTYPSRPVMRRELTAR